MITDLHMPDLDGVAATRELIGRWPDLAVLVLTMLDDDESVFSKMRRCPRLPAQGRRPHRAGATAQALARGETVFGPGVARRIVGFFLESSQRYAEGALPGLTARERQVLDLLAGGARNVDIAQSLGMSEKTVRNHLSSVFAKLHVADRTAAAVRARELGLGRHQRP